MGYRQERTRYNTMCMGLFEIRDEDLEVVDVSRSNRISINGTSKGNQLKWYKDGKFIKLDMLGYEGIAEVMVSYLLSYTTLKKDVDWVEYHQCLVVEEGKLLGVGCYSLDFRGGLVDISSAKFLRKYGMSFGIGYYDFIDFIDDCTGLQCKNYIDRILCLDSITRNDDRHFNNINFLYDKINNKYSFAPIYDNGCACLSDLVSYPITTDFYKNYNSVQAKPFDIDFLYQIHNPLRLCINYTGFIDNINVRSYNEERAVNTVIKGLEDTKGISWEEVY